MIQVQEWNPIATNMCKQAFSLDIITMNKSHFIIKGKGEVIIL